jgi:hypothetical protein
VRLQLLCSTGSEAVESTTAIDMGTSPEWNEHFSLLVDDAAVDILDVQVMHKRIIFLLSVHIQKLLSSHEYLSMFITNIAYTLQ